VVFAKASATVIVGYAHSEAAAQETVSALGGAAVGGAALRLDVADAKACAAAVESITKEHGRFDVLVNNAGIAVDGLVMRIKDEDWDRQINTNLKGAFALIRAASRQMMKQKAGTIVNICSVVGETGNAGQAAYSASKAGLIGLTKSVARELASRNIRVNAVSPGFIATDMTSAIPAPAKDKLLDSIPLARLGTSEEVAQAVLFLASDAASYITGEVLKVNGGMYM